MTLKQTERLVALLRKYGVSHFADGSVTIHLRPQAAQVIESPAGSAPEAPESYKHDKATPAPVASIPHHENEVLNMLELSDNDLVDKLFPEG